MTTFANIPSLCKKIIPYIILYFISVSLAWAKDNNQTITVSISPLYSIFSDLAKDSPNIKLKLIGGGTASPHTFNLKANDIIDINQSNFIFIISRYIETPLFNAVRDKDKVIEVAEERDIKKAILSLYNYNEYDYHVWTNPLNMIIIAKFLYNFLVVQDRENIDIYKRNLNHVIASLSNLDKEITRELEPYKNKGFVVYHDEYSYFYNRYGLNYQGYIATNPESGVLPNDMMQIRQKVQMKKISCIIAAKGASKNLIERLINNDKNIKIVDVDSGGSTISNSYSDFLHKLTNNFIQCLQ